MSTSIQARLGQARERWPGVRVEEGDFLRLVGGTDDGDGHLEELWLAWACTRRDPAAIAHFEAAYFAEVDAAYRRFDDLPVTLEDVRQRMRERLYLHDPPSLAGYSGRGELRAWLRAAALHMLVNIATRESRERPIDDAFFDAVLDTGADAEAAYLKQACREEFEKAFTAAMQRLEPRERVLLKYAFADRRNVDEIGAVFRVHRATAARWVAGARDRLVQETRAELMRELQIDERDAASIVRAALSRMGTTLLRQFGNL